MSSSTSFTDDPYRILGVGKDATESEIQRAYRKLALKHHPDRNPDDASAAAKFKQASEAYEILNDPEKRRAYDSGGMENVNRAGFSGFADNEEIYSRYGDVFAEFFGGRDRPRPPRRTRGRDLRFGLSVDFRTAVLGGKIAIEVPIPVTCGQCQGSGVSGGPSALQCEYCNGSGQVAKQTAEQGGYFTIATACPACAGTGRQEATPCGSCHGQGHVVRNKSITITIPPGMETGHVLRIRGQGQSGSQGGPSGDLLVEVTVDANKVFRRDGPNIHSDVRIPLETALLGGQVDVATVRGKVSMTVPPGTSSDRSLRIRGQGVDAPGVKGDHFVHLIVDIPKRPFTASEQETLRQLLRASG
jgi:molecular chaperone DnaJ